MNLTSKEYLALGRSLANSACVVLLNSDNEHIAPSKTLSNVRNAMEMLKRAEEAFVNGTYPKEATGDTEPSDPPSSKQVDNQ